MGKSRLIKTIPDTEYNKLMFSEAKEYYNNPDLDFTSTYRALDESLEWREPTTPRKVFFDIFNKIKIKKEWAFLDCGSGLGHTVYLATFLFDKVYGVEYLKEIYDISQKNLKILLPDNQNYKIFCTDIFGLSIDFLSEINVFYISSPFIEESMFEKLSKNIVSSIKAREREVWIIYFYPHCEKVLKKYHDIIPLQFTLQSIGKVNYYRHSPRLNPPSSPLENRQEYKVF